MTRASVEGANTVKWLRDVSSSPAEVIVPPYKLNWNWPFLSRLYLLEKSCKIWVIARFFCHSILLRAWLIETHDVIVCFLTLIPWLGKNGRNLTSQTSDISVSSDWKLCSLIDVSAFGSRKVIIVPFSMAPTEPVNGLFSWSNGTVAKTRQSMAKHELAESALTISVLHDHELHCASDRTCKITERIDIVARETGWGLNRSGRIFSRVTDQQRTDFHRCTREKEGSNLCPTQLKRCLLIYLESTHEAIHGCISSLASTAGKWGIRTACSYADRSSEKVCEIERRFFLNLITYSQQQGGRMRASFNH